MDENTYRSPKLLLVVVLIIGALILLQWLLTGLAPLLWPDYPAD
jgi:hypothetical protein